MAKKLRFAALIRVSTEKQEKTGESLRTQTTEIKNAVAQIGGNIVEWYGGQEHATAGHEKKEINRLLKDASKTHAPFDAVIVAHADRWSRDNAKSMEGLDVFKNHRIRFFVHAHEHDLYKPDQRMVLGMHAVFGAYQAATQNEKSILCRIHRAKRNVPTGGKLPFGRTFDKVTETWGIDKKKQAMIKDVAKRYLAGESLAALASEYDVNHSNLHKILTQRCGTKWEVTFRNDDFDIHEVVKLDVPALLPQATIKAIIKRTQANKTYQHGKIKHPYLFSRMVFCAHCGYAMFGQTNANGHRYYRHAHKRRAKECNGPRAWVRAEVLEDTVIRHLFECFGNPVAIQKAIEAATPNRAKVDEARQRQSRIVDELSKIEAARGTILRLITKGTITESQAEKELDELQAKEARYQEELESLCRHLENMPTAEAIKEMSKKMSARFKRRASPRLVARMKEANRDYESMTWDEKRALVEMVFSGKTVDGQRMGVRVEWIDGQKKRRQKSWRYTIAGHLIHEQGILSAESRQDDLFSFDSSPVRQKELVTKYASHSPGKALLGCRWRRARLRLEG